MIGAELPPTRPPISTDELNAVTLPVAYELTIRPGSLLRPTSPPTITANG
jgi:hypothetical protein